MTDIHRIAQPTPFPVGPVNSFVLMGEPLALVDPGPRFPPARLALEQGLAQLGLGLADVELILITHPHVDHYGQAGEIAAASGAAVAGHSGAAARVGRKLHQGQPGEQEAMDEVLARSGAPGEFGPALFAKWSLADALVAPVRMDRVLEEGDRVRAGGVDWRVLHTPGHSPGSASFFDEASGRLLSGDTLLERISSNAIMEFRPSDGGSGRPRLVRERTLEQYLGSLRRLERLPVTLVLPGHGPPFTGHRAVLEQRMRHYAARRESVVAALRDLGPTPAFPLARALFPEQAEEMGQFLALSEVLGHLDLLVSDGQARHHTNGTVDRYELIRG